MRYFFLAIAILVTNVLNAQDSVFNDLSQALRNPSEVVELNLRKQGLTTFPDSVLRLFPNLKALDLSRNKIADLPDDLSYLNGLVLLDLSDNRLKQIPSSIRNLTQLVRLNFSFNEIDSLPIELFTLGRLQYLGLAGNKLQYIVNEVVGLSSLKELDVRGKQLNFISRADLMSMFKQEILVKKSPGCGC